MSANTEDFGYRVLMRVLFGLGGEPPAWREFAACADQDPKLFHTARRIAVAKSICAMCLVRTECLQDQLMWEANGPARWRSEAAGVVGGLTGAERRRLHRSNTNTNSTKDVA